MNAVVDNYDSFTYNLVQHLGSLGAHIEVFRNDAVSVEALAARRPRAIVISPGPCTPKEAGISVEVIRRLGPSVPILGVCLGHQCIGEAFGGRVVRAPAPVHGKVARICHDGRTIYEGLPAPFDATRYHSLVVARDGLPAELEVSAWLEDGMIMGLRHRQHPVEGVQFHPESVLTAVGKQMLGRFLALAEAFHARRDAAAAAGAHDRSGLPSAPEDPASTMGLGGWPDHTCAPGSPSRSTSTASVARLPGSTPAEARR